MGLLRSKKQDIKTAKKCHQPISHETRTSATLKNFFEKNERSGTFATVPFFQRSLFSQKQGGLIDKEDILLK